MSELDTLGKLVEDIGEDFNEALLRPETRAAVLRSRYSASDRMIRFLGDRAFTEQHDFFQALDELVTYLSSWQIELKENQFSAQFQKQFTRFVTRSIGRKDDIFIIHFSADVELEDIVALRDGLDSICRAVLLDNELVSLSPAARSWVEQNRIIRVRTVKYTNSIEAFFQLLLSPEVGQLIDLVQVSVLIAGILVSSARGIHKAAKWLHTWRKRRDQDPPLPFDEDESKGSKDKATLLRYQAAWDYDDPGIPDSVKDSTAQYSEKLADWMSMASVYMIFKTGPHLVGMEN